MYYTLSFKQNKKLEYGYIIHKVYDDNKVEEYESSVPNCESKEEVIDNIKECLPLYEEYLGLKGKVTIEQSDGYDFYIGLSGDIAKGEGTEFIPSIEGFHSFYQEIDDAYKSALQHIFE